MLVTFEVLKNTFSGEIIVPGDAEYKNASGVFMHTGNPAVVLRPKNTQDIVTAVRFATENKLVLSVRSGGHSGPGFGTNSGGMVIDMSLFNTIEVLDTEKHIVRIGSGARRIDVATTLGQHRLALSSGDTKTVGVGGLTLGGGIGWLVRKVGLTIDNLLAAEIVTAGGKTLRISSTENPDLFWGIRGAGANFGVATSFEFQATPIGKVFAGPISYGIENIKAVLTGWRDTMRSAPEELNSMIVVLPSFGGNPPGVMVLTCYAGDNEAEAMKAIDPLKSFGNVTMQAVAQKDYAQVLEDAHPPEGIEVIAKNVFLKSFSDEVIQTITKMCETAIPILQIRYLGGAMNRVPADATAFPHRDSEVLLVCPTFLPVGATPDVIEKAMQPWKTIAAFGSGTYANLLSTATSEDVHAAYLNGTYDRLAKLKKTYDPENIFRLNYNVQPA